MVGKVSFSEDKLNENVTAVVDSINKLKPSSSKGKYMKKFTISSTMGPGIKVDAGSISK